MDLHARFCLAPQETRSEVSGQVAESLSFVVELQRRYFLRVEFTLLELLVLLSVFEFKPRVEQRHNTAESVK